MGTKEAGGLEIILKHAFLEKLDMASVRAKTAIAPFIPAVIFILFLER